MEERTHFAVLGGDRRQRWLAEALESRGCEVRMAAVPGAASLPGPGDLSWALQGRDAVVLPMPAFDENDCVSGMGEAGSLKALLALLKPGTAVYGGRLTAAQAAALEQKERRAIDYGSMEQLAVRNAIPTAEGAIALALAELPVTLWRSKCLVLGYGRVGKALSHRLRDLGAEVTVAARNPKDLAMIGTMGMQTMVTGGEIPSPEKLDLVINTVPARVLGREALEQLPAKVLILDLASKPGGVDRQAAKELGRRTIWALGLPGKTAPVTAGALIAEVILDHWKEMREKDE